MVFLFHPVMSFIVPLAVACLLWPSLRRTFPELAWFTGTGKGPRLVRAYMIVSFALVMAMNSGGPINLTFNLAFAVLLLLALLRLDGPATESRDGQDIVVFGRWGFVGLCAYLMFLYGVTYVLLRPDGLPSMAVQLFTVVFYAGAIIGLVIHHGSERLPVAGGEVDERERQLVKRVFTILAALAIPLSLLAGNPVLYIPIVANFLIWTPLGFVLTGTAIVRGAYR